MRRGKERETFKEKKKVREIREQVLVLQICLVSFSLVFRKFCKVGESYLRVSS